MLAQRRSQWANITPALDWRLVFAIMVNGGTAAQFEPYIRIDIILRAMTYFENILLITNGNLYSNKDVEGLSEFSFQIHVLGL